MSYTALLSSWRHAPAGSPYFQGEVGDHYKKVMAKKKEEIGNAAAVAISKEIGW
jgi:hypothetical protein